MLHIKSQRCHVSLQKNRKFNKIKAISRLLQWVNAKIRPREFGQKKSATYLRFVIKIGFTISNHNFTRAGFQNKNLTSYFVAPPWILTYQPIKMDQ